jgi:hypothetical protein
MAQLLRIDEGQHQQGALAAARGSHRVPPVGLDRIQQYSWQHGYDWFISNTTMAQGLRCKGCGD